MKTVSSSASNGQVLAQPAGNMENGTASEKLFYEVQDGMGFVYRVANMNNKLVCPRKGMVQIEAISRHKGKQANFSFCNAFDSKLKIWYGVPVGIDQRTKELIWKRFYLPEFRQYNLSLEEDAIEWAIVSRCNFMEGSMFAAGKPSFRKYDLEAEAIAKIERISAVEEAVRIAKTLKLRDWISVARFFGKNPEAMSATQLQAEVYMAADKQPQKLIAYWTDSNREVIDIFNAAKAYGIITYDITKGYLYKRTMPIGNTEQQAIAFTIKDPQFARGLAMAVKDKDITERMITANDAPDSLNLNDLRGEDNRELVALQMEAQLYNIKGWEIMTKDDLTKEILTAKQEAESIREE